MSIELMKKLEDLKQLNGQYYRQLSDKIDQKKSQYIREVISDFSKFFNEKGFKVNATSGVSEATYGNLKAVLSYDDPATDYMGVLFRFDLDLTDLNKSKLNVLLNRKEPGISMSFSSSNPNESEDSKLQKEISRVEQDLDEVKSRLDNFGDEKWNLFIKDETQNYGYQYSEPYASMYDLLTDLIK